VEQEFPLPPAERISEIDIVAPGFVKYRPWNDPYVALSGKRRLLLLDPRGGLKTSINCVAHLVQWILNYPHLAYLVVQSNAKKASDIMREIKKVFQYNTMFRQIYPDYCPQRHVSDWGNREEVDIPDEETRDRILAEMKVGRKEHTIMTASIDKGSAGYHWDVMKFSDIVEENNTRTEDQIESVKYTFEMMENLLVKLDGWIDVEGTRYDLFDLYGKIIVDWEKNEKMRAEWKIHVRSCFERDFGDQPHTFTPDMLKLPFKKTEKGEYISWWPSRFPLDKLMLQQTREPYVFATQRLNDPLAAQGDNIPFPPKLMQWITKDEFSKVPLSHFLITVDTADTIGLRSNPSCITVCGWDKYQRCYVVEVKLGKMLPDALIEAIIAMYKRYRPMYVKIEETAFVRGLKAGLMRRCNLEGLHIPFDYITRDNQTSKKERILTTLQPWYKAKEIVFLDTLDCKHEIQTQLASFPSGEDDFLDTLADQFQNRDWFGRLSPRGDSPELRKHMQIAEEQRGIEKWLRIADDDDEEYSVPIPVGSMRWKTGE
jgi:predicted phage terminase large subunit-like protein